LSQEEMRLTQSCMCRSDADSDILADYVLALLKHEGDIASTRELCESELKDFFQDGRLLHAQQTVFPDAMLTLKIDAFECSEFVEELFRVLEYNSYLPGAPPPPPKPDPNAPPPNAPTEPRSHKKRKANDDSADYMTGIEGAAAPKMARFDNAQGFSALRPDAPVWMPAAFGGDPNAPMNMNMGIDMNALANLAMFNQNFLAMFTGVTDPGNMLGATTTMNNGRKPKKKKKRVCHEWEKTGTCSKGDNCRYQHLNMNLPFPMLDMPGLTDLSDTVNGQDTQANGKSRPKRVPKGQKDKRVYDLEPCRVYVKDIPDENFGEEAIREFFQEFGTITDVVLQAHNNSALVRFSDQSAASAAVDSPKPVFDNRFVSVVPARVLRKVNDPSAPDFNMDEVVQKQEEAQRVFEEKKKLRDELQQKLDELEKQETDIRKEQFALKRKIAEKTAGLARKNGAATDEEGSDMDILRAQLAALEDEAVALGLTPVNGSEFEDGGSGEAGYVHAPFRGGFRGGYRGRGRGRYRGDIHVAYGRAMLDNRPKTIAVQGVDFTVTAYNEALRQYLMGIGVFTDIQSTPSTTHIVFEERKTAEAFWSSLVHNPIPGVQGVLELSWVANTTASLVGRGADKEGEEGEEKIKNGGMTALLI
ncbi:hypothetical protein TD95_001475, partial [Thielaviopsis punctulata]